MVERDLSSEASLAARSGAVAMVADRARFGAVGMIGS